MAKTSRRTSRQRSSKRRITSIRRNLNARVSVSYYSGYRVTLRWVRVGFFVFILSLVPALELEEKRRDVRFARYRLEMKDDKRGERQRGVENTLRNLNILSRYVVSLLDLKGIRDPCCYSYLTLFELHR